MTQDTVSATEFKAKCLDILDQVGARRVDQVSITKRGKVVAVLVAPPDQASAIRDLHGFLRGSVLIPAGIDLTDPVLDETLTAGEGVLHA